VSPSPSASPLRAPPAASFSRTSAARWSTAAPCSFAKDRGRLDADREGSLALVDTGDRALFLNAGSDDRVERRLEGGLFAEDRLVGREVLGDSHVGGSNFATRSPSSSVTSPRPTATSTSRFA